MKHPKYSVIVPVYNRPVEVDDLLGSLASQTFTDFEVVLVEDGSTETCEDVVRKYVEQLRIDYYFKENTGPGDSRNVGMQKAHGEYLVFFDSDCIIPADYFQNVDDFLKQHPEVDAFGGPDDAHPSFSSVQKAINYSMTSLITTGGVRGRKKHLDNYQPRSFNMGISREVYLKVGGFSDIHPGEDPDLSYRIMNADFSIAFIEKARVYHKRRIDFSKFAKQVYKFGVVRTILHKWYPDKFKVVYTFPAIFLVGSVALILMSVISWLFLVPLSLLVLLIFLECLVKTKSIVVSCLAIPASFIQLYWYGSGFIEGAVKIFMLRRNERESFAFLFFKKANPEHNP